MKTSFKSNLSPFRQLLFALGSAGFNLLERLIVLYVPFYFLPPMEYGVHNLLPAGVFWGFATVLGTALVVGRLFDSLADPIIASLSDSSQSPLGRRKVFLLFSGLPLATFGALIFFPHLPGEMSMLNGVWLGVVLCFFYIAYTGYVNPYLSLISDLGHTEDLRLKLSTKVALFGLMATLAVTAGLPLIVTALTNTGIGLRGAYQISVVAFSAVATLLLYAATLGFTEARPKREQSRPAMGTWASLKETYTHKPFRIFVLGEMLLQYGINIMTMALLYFVVVIFQKPEGFMSLIAVAMVVVALASFPVVNYAARKNGKKKVLIAGVCVLVFCSSALFFLSFNMTGVFAQAGVVVLAMAGVPLAVLAILINPTIAGMARARTLQTGVAKEAMFFAARAIPVKLVIALAG
ncbi:MAG: MFS transporter, partial [Bacillota bacterium]|nr:MFS transporter [Bacillota bacterium]